MATHNYNDSEHSEASLMIFIDILTDEFRQKTGYGVYAYLTHADVYHAYLQLQLRQVPMRQFASHLVKAYL